MNFVIHGLSGAVLARALPEEHRSAATVAGMAAAACLPDIDCVSILWGRDAFLAVHRGYTHSVAGILLTSLVFALAWCAARGGVRRAAAFAWIAAAQYMHVFLDLLNPYGVRPLMPFTDRRMSIGTDISGDSIVVLLAFMTAALWLYRVETLGFILDCLGLGPVRGAEEKI
jgi:inner membrane protein